MKPPLQKLIETTKIVHHENQFRKLQIAEAVSITCQRPSINIQQAADFILPSARPQIPERQQEQRAPPRTITQQRAPPRTITQQRSPPRTITQQRAPPRTITHQQPERQQEQRATGTITHHNPTTNQRTGPTTRLATRLATLRLNSAANDTPGCI